MRKLIKKTFYFVFNLILIIISLFPLLDSIIFSDLFIIQLTDEIIVSNEYSFSESMLKALRKLNKTHIYIPMGRIQPNKKIIEVKLNSQEIVGRNFTDECGGSWINLSLATLPNDSIIKTIFNCKDGKLIDYQEISDNHSFWLIPSKYIDSNNSILVDLSLNLTANLSSNTEKAIAIYEFLRTKIKNKEHKTYDYENASQIYQIGFGSCRHKARLFVALCRAADVPARTIHGLIALDFSPSDHLHEWVEYLNESGYWIQVDPTNGNWLLEDRRLIDLYFAKYQNNLLIFNLDDENDSSMVWGDISSFKILSVKKHFVFFCLTIYFEYYQLIGVLGISVLVEYYLGVYQKIFDKLHPSHKTIHYRSFQKMVLKDFKK